ncbi:hypothetical protein J6590_047910 [Homalodisca vitripennis]|nr:hypothetical protein J6590_047910 [Homalodisca vitripennis]
MDRSYKNDGRDGNQKSKIYQDFQKISDMGRSSRCWSGSFFIIESETDGSAPTDAWLPGCPTVTRIYPSVAAMVSHRKISVSKFPISPNIAFRDLQEDAQMSPRVHPSVAVTISQVPYPVSCVIPSIELRNLHEVSLPRCSPNVTENPLVLVVVIRRYRYPSSLSQFLR